MTSPTNTTTDTTTLSDRLERIGMRAAAASADDLIARATTGRWGAATLLDELARIALNGFESAFLPWADRSRLLQRVRAHIDQLSATAR